MTVGRFCDWLLRTFAADKPVRGGEAVSAWAWDHLMAENQRLRQERNDLLEELTRRK